MSRIGRVLGVLLVLTVAAQLIGIDVIGWMERVWDQINNVDPIYIVVACALQTAQTGFVAFGLRNILNASYPDRGITFKLAFGTYAASVAGNSVLPAKGGTVIMLGLWRIAIPKSAFVTFVAVLAVNSIAFAVFQILNYVYILISPVEGLNGEIRRESNLLTWIAGHPWQTLAIAAVVVAIAAILVRRFWPKLRSTWHRVLAGAAILRTPWRYVVGVFVPQTLSYLCRLGKTAVLMEAFGIPVTLRSVILVTVGSSLAGLFQITPGGLGTKQAMHCAALADYTDCTTATSWSLSQQAITTVWNLVLGVGGLTWAFGWSQTKDLVKRRKEVVAQVRADTEAENARTSEDRTA
jgi:uncharacterized membrane protein YbhN (UPF0104 family)